MRDSNKSPSILSQICNQKIYACLSINRLLLQEDIKMLSLNDFIQQKLYIQFNVYFNVLQT